ncbi:MAG: PfkB family carbohydrate kinase [Chloroflexota bacterium]
MTARSSLASALEHLIQRAPHVRLAVLGDLVLDEYIVGRATRLSREAPIPVLDQVDRFTRPGSASNPAMNLVTLGASVDLVGVVGADPAGETLLTDLGAAGISCEHVLQLPGRATSTKTRILAEHASAHRQQVARVDHVPRERLTSPQVAALGDRVHQVASSANAILLSDYKAGVVVSETIDAALRSARSHAIPSLVDSQGDLDRFAGYTLVKSNLPDAEASIGRPLDTEETIGTVGYDLLRTLAAEMVLITRGAAGMSLIRRGGAPAHLPPANQSEVWDVTGAGDTVIAVLGLGLAVGLDPLDAARLANHAAGIVVRRLGVVSVGPDELRAAVQTA